MAQGRRVRRVVRRIDPSSVLKVALLFWSSLVLVFLLAGVLLWAAGSAAGAIGGLESFIEALGFEDFRFVGGQLLRGFVAGGLVVVVMGTGASFLAAVLYNLISDVVGGIELTVLEEIPLPPAPSPAAVAAQDATTTRPVRAKEERAVTPGYPA